MPSENAAGSEREAAMQDQMIRMISSRATPVPGVGDQVVSEVKDVMDTAKETAQTLVGNLPVFLTHLVISLGVIVVGLIMVRIVRMIIRALLKGRSKSDLVKARRAQTAGFLASSIIGYIMYLIIIGVVLYLFGVDVRSIFTAVGVVSIAISFGAQTLVKDIISGLFLWGEGNLTVGDLVTINDLSGTVEAVTVRTTSIRNWNGNLVVIPNGDIRTITNMSRGFKRAIVNIPCPYEENHQRIVEILREEMVVAGKEIKGIEKTPEVMSIISFEHNAVMVQIAVACPVGEHWRIERDIRSRVKARFDQEGIIMPHYTFPKEGK